MAKRKKPRKRISLAVPAKGRLREMADRLWSLAVRNEWNHRCAVCGGTPCNAHHLLPRQWYATRYSLLNGIALCKSHHVFDAAISPHQNAAGWMEWLRVNRCDIHRWLEDTVADGEYREFADTKTAAYFCGIIRSLQEYVEPEQFDRICGVKFSRWLEDNDE